VHLIPLRAFDPTFRPDLDAIKRMQTQLQPINANNWGTYYDLVGIFISGGNSPETRNGYIYALRTGALEIVDMSMFAWSGEDKLIPSLQFENEILGNLVQWFTALRAMKAEPPVVLMISLLNVQGYTMALPLGMSSYGTHPIMREHLYLPGTVIESLILNSDSRETPHNIFDVLRPHFDVLWNACGFPQSIYFDAEGNPQHRTRY
jgi:hypothetical protein